MKRLAPYRCLRVAAAVFVLLQQPACYSWRIRSLEQQRRVSRVETLRLALPNGEQVVMVDGTIVGDSMVGRADGDRNRRLAIELRDIRDISVRQFDGGKTAFLAGGVGVAGVALFGLVSAGTCGAGATPAC